MLSKRRLKLILITQIVWLVIICILGGWWGTLLLKQADRIAELEKISGISNVVIEQHWARTQRMLFWESSTFFVLLLGVTCFFFWLYWRDVKRMRGVQAFFASMTHELRTPLTSIRLQAESIAETVLPTSDQGELVGRLLEDTTRLEAQVERTLELARVEGGGSVYTQPFQVKPWIDWFMKTWNEIPQVNSKLNVEMNVQDHVIEADLPSMQVVLKNLLENSARHSKSQNLKVQLSTQISSDHRGWVVLRYKDNGQNFDADPKNLGKLFYKGPSSQGAGVGLYLIGALMKRMGGWAEFNATSTGFEARLWFKNGGAPHV